MPSIYTLSLVDDSAYATIALERWPRSLLEVVPNGAKEAVVSTLYAPLRI